MAEASPYQSEDAASLAGELFGGKLTIEEALQRLRTRLLDLSMRNRLLNYRHPKGRTVQFVNEPDLDLLFDRLEEGKAVSLAYVADPPVSRYDQGKKPDARTYAVELGINTSVEFEGLSAKSAFKRLPAIQVIQYPADLEKFLRKIATEARTVIEETGTNMLYLMFGFLEFFDSEDSDKPCLAPLISMPVSLVRGALDQDSRTYRYDLSYSGEDIVENFTLREKLKQDHLELPELDPEESPGSYFAKIQAAVSKRKNWRVRRRLSLGFLSFGKLAIWSDLDPAKSKSLLTSPLLKEIFEGGTSAQTESFHAEDYDIDDHPDGELPLIYDADSSQHSAIIDVRKGNNLVINGPPGTGKSQTITNLIASALAAGKKVLFVSEKLAALEVVKQRLSMAGLGDFCLELHSHKTQKKQLLENIEHRIAARFRAPEGYATRVDVLRERRRILNAYAELLGSRSGSQLDMAVHDIFWATERRRAELGLLSEELSDRRFPLASEWSGQTLDAYRNALASAAAAAIEMGCPVRHSPWRGFAPDVMVRGDELPVLRIITASLDHARAMESATAALAQATNRSGWTIQESLRAHGVFERLTSPGAAVDPHLMVQLLPEGIASLGGARATIKRLTAELAHTRGLAHTAKANLTSLDVVDSEKFERLSALAREQLGESALRMTPAKLRDVSAKLAERLAILRSTLNERIVRIPSEPGLLHATLASSRSLVEEPQFTFCSAASLREVPLQTSAALSDLVSQVERFKQLLEPIGVNFGGHIDEIQALTSGDALSELVKPLPSPDIGVEGLRELLSAGFGEWTAVRLADESKALREEADSAVSAVESLRNLAGRVGLPLEVSVAGFSSLETLVGIAVDAPSDLLALRTSGLERADAGEVAIRAEEAHKRVQQLSALVQEVFHVESLPGPDAIKACVHIFRRGDSLFNFLRSDWRKAKATYVACARKSAPVSARGMAERMSVALKWQEASGAYEGNELFRSTLGRVFEGTSTDYSKVRRLHGWYRRSLEALFADGELGQHVNLTSLPEPHIALLAAQAARTRTSMELLRNLPARAAKLPGFEQARLRVRRLDELLPPLLAYATRADSAASSLAAVVQPGTTVARAIALIELRVRLAQNKDLLEKLIESPVHVAEVSTKLGLPATRHSCLNLLQSMERLSKRSMQLGELGGVIGAALGGDVTPREARDAVNAYAAVTEISQTLVPTGTAAADGAWGKWLDAHDAAVRTASDLASFLVPFANADVSIWDAGISVQAAFDAQSQLGRIAHDHSYQSHLGGWLRGLDTDEGGIAACLAWAEAVQQASKDLPGVACNALLSLNLFEVDAQSRTAAATFESSFAAYQAAMKGLESFGVMDWKSWGGSPTPTDAVQRLIEAQQGSSILTAWSKYLAAKSDSQGLGLGAILDLVETGGIPAERLGLAFEFVFYKSLSKGIISSKRALGRFSGSGHEQVRREFATLDKELIELTGTEYAARIDKAKKPSAGVSTGRAADLTEMSLLVKETKKQKRHIPIRQLLSRAGRSLQELKPCFMMGPLSVAQYLQQGVLEFDLVVMDEASQLRPEDALGAVARGKQLVVVGDPKQLPPTNFFDRLMDGEDEDADDVPAVIEGVESILGICEHLYRPVRTLRWHYRSKHESLIAFSNSQFYAGQLVVFPSPYKRNKQLGVNYRYVTDGVYADRRNLPEAQRVVEAVVEHMLSNPDESLGVVTLNQTQRELIEDLLDKRIRDQVKFSAYLARHEESGWKFFVKNLENVQGDERDVIFVSTTFGKPPNASVVRQNFGPINRPDGWRRLNVLFTRARKRLDLFTSMLPSDVLTDGAASAGRRALHDYLEFARNGNLPMGPAEVGVRSPDSDFEISVADALRKQGFEPEPQVGVAGYFLDIGVRNSLRRGEFLAGIECDGATYHSSRSARDRDRIRQEILESLGWRGRIIRVWSTDWFSDPKGQTERLLRFLRERQAASATESTPYSDELFDTFEQASGASGFGALQREEEAAEPVQVLEAAREPSTDAFVEVGDRVTYCVTQAPDERHTVQIVDSPSNLRLGLLNEETPLARALLGNAAGDESSFHVPGHPPRTVRIVKIHRGLDDVP